MVHRDIKLSNLLYTKHGQLKLADFGLARYLSQPPPMDLTPVVMTLWYRAPEVLLELGNYSFAVDCWSTGCILAELLLQRPLFHGESELETIETIFRLLGAPTERIWPEVVNSKLVQNQGIDLVREQRRYPYNTLSDRFPSIHRSGLDLLDSLLAYRPSHRISARDASQHQYFQTSPYPVSEDFMPTFPSFHDDDVAKQKQERASRLQHQSRSFTHQSAVRLATKESNPSRGEKRPLTNPESQHLSKRK